MAYRFRRLAYRFSRLAYRFQFSDLTIKADNDKEARGQKMTTKCMWPLLNVCGPVHRTASTLFLSDWDGKPHGVGYLAAGTDMNRTEDGEK